MLDLVTHHVDLYRWLMKDDLAQIHARLQTCSEQQVAASIFGNTCSGIEFSGFFAYGTSRSHAATVHGTKGVLRLDLHSGSITLQKNRRRAYGVRSGNLQWGPSSWLWRLRKAAQPSFDPSHRLALRAFIETIQRPSQRHRDLATLADGVEALQLVLKAESGAMAP